MSRQIFFCSFIALLLGCGNALKPGSGAPIPMGLLEDEFAAIFASAKPISSLDLPIGVNPTDTIEATVQCPGGGSAHGRRRFILNGTSSGYLIEFSYSNCAITMTLVGQQDSETLNGTSSFFQNPISGSNVKISVSFSGTLGLALSCDTTQSISNTTSGTCKLFDAAGGSIDFSFLNSLSMAS